MSGVFRRIALPEIKDMRGSLMFAEEGRHVPFPIKRVFAIYAVPDGAERGGHAHRQQEQFIFMLTGACTVVADDGKGRSEMRLSTPTDALYVPAGTWLELTRFSDDAVCVVLASGLFDESDYVRDKNMFERWKATGPAVPH